MNDNQIQAVVDLIDRFGDYCYLNEFRSHVAIHVDFPPCESHPYGSSWRIAPDGEAQDITDALMEGLDA